MKSISKIIDIPKERHYAVFEVKTTNIHHEGDERSRTNPGHGYPAWTEQIVSVEYRWSLDQDELKKFMERHLHEQHKYYVAEVNPLQVETKINFTTKVMRSG